MKRKKVDIRLPSGKIVYGYPEHYNQETTETASVEPVETATKPKPEPKHVGGGWYEVNGERVKGKEEAEKLADPL